MTGPTDEELAAYRALTADSPEARAGLIEVVEEWPIDGRARQTERVRRELVDAIKAETVNTSDVMNFTVPRLIEVVANLEARLTELDGNRSLNTFGL